MYVYDSGSIVYCLDFPAISAAMKYQSGLKYLGRWRYAILINYQMCLKKSSVTFLWCLHNMQNEDE